MSGRKRNSDTSMDSRYGSDGGRGSSKRYNDGGRDRGRDSDRNGGGDRDRGRRREGGGGGGGGSYDELADVAARWSEFTVFRLLCPSARVGSVLGRGGAIIKQLREETGARIRVNDAPQGAGERDVVVWSHESKPSSERTRDDPCPAQIALLKVHARICRGDAANDSDARMRKGGGADGSGGDEEEEEEAVVVARLLVPGSQVGCVLGKGGSVVAQMRRDTKTHIKISGSGSRLLPECAAPSDELVQISGDYDGVNRALEMVLERLREFPTRDALPLPMVQHAPPQHSHQPYHHAAAFAEYATSTSGPMMYPVVPAVPPLPFAAAAGLAYGGGGGGSAWHSSPPPPPGTAFRPGALVPLPISAAAASRSRGGAAGYLDVGAMGGAGAGASAGMVVEVVLRLLCPEARVGSVIGKGGAFIRQVQTETRSRIKVAEKAEDCDERVVIIACDEAASAVSSGAEEALMRIVSRAVFAEAEHRDAGPDGGREGGGGGGVTVRLLVPHAHTGCLLGKGGSIIQHMRRTSAAHIRVLPAADLPKCGLETDELVQVSGNSTSVALALRLIAAHLRANAVSEAANATPAAAPPSQMPAVLSPYPSHDAQARSSLPSNAGSGRAYGYGDEDMAQQQPSYASAYSDPYGNGAAGGAAAGQSYLSPAQAAPSYSADPSGGAAAAAAAAAAGAGSSGGGGSGAGVSTVLVAVPAVASGAIIGKGGSNIAQIRSISGARVRLYDVAEGEAERLVEVVGTTDQVQAAQALIQAFVIKGTAAAAAAAAGGGGGGGTGGGVY